MSNRINQKRLKRVSWIIVICFLFVGGLAVIPASRLQLKTEVADLLSEGNAKAEAFNRILDNFKTTSSVMMAIEGESPLMMEQAAAQLKAGFLDAAPEDIRSIQGGVPEELVRRWGLQLADDEAAKGAAFLAGSPSLISLSQILSREAEMMEKEWHRIDLENDQDTLEQFARLFRRQIQSWHAYHTAVDNSYSHRPVEETAENLVDLLFVPSASRFSADYSMLIFSVIPDFSVEDRERIMDLMDKLTPVIEQIGSQYPELIISAAGEIPQEADEEEAMGFDLLYPALLSLVGIILLFALFLQGIRSVIFVGVSLGFGILINLGIVGLTIGELNIMTSSFGALIIGLGADFGIHLINHVQKGAGKADAVISALKHNGKPILLGGITTSLAFYTLCFSTSRGFQQFGIVAGTGILTVLASMMLLLPALMTLFSKGRNTIKSDKKPKVRQNRATPSFGIAGHYAQWLHKRRWILLAVITLAVGLGFAFVGRLEFNPDFRNIGPQNTPAKAAEQRIQDKLDINPFPSFYIAETVEQAEEIARELRLHPLVNEVVSISDFLPQEEDHERIRQRLELTARFFRRGEVLELSGSELNAAAETVSANMASVFESVQSILSKAETMNHPAADTIKRISSDYREELSDIMDHGKRENSEAGPAVFGALNNSVGREILNHLMLQIQDRRIMTLDDLPSDIKSSMVSPAGYLVTVFPTAEVAGKEGMTQFDQAMEEIHPEIIGMTALTLELADEVSRDMLISAGLVLLLVVIILSFGFRHPGYALLAVFNLAIGIILMLGLYAVTKELNLISMLAIPLIIGIGIDYGIHILDGFKRSLSVGEILGTSGRGIILSGATTMIGFGSLALIGSFEGIAALGWILFLGAFFCVAASLSFLPLIFCFRFRNRKNRPGLAEMEQRGIPEASAHNPVRN